MRGDGVDTKEADRQPSLQKPALYLIRLI